VIAAQKHKPENFNTHPSQNKTGSSWQRVEQYDCRKHQNPSSQQQQNSRVSHRNTFLKPEAEVELTQRVWVQNSTASASGGTWTAFIPHIQEIDGAFYDPGEF